MTNAELLAKIKAEIERRIELHDSLASNAESEMIANLEIGAAQALDDLRSFISTIESEKPLGLDEEIKRYYDDMDGDCRYAQTARHFYELGCRRTAEKADEIEYNRQRAEESEKPLGLEEEIERYLSTEWELDEDMVGSFKISLSKKGGAFFRLPVYLSKENRTPYGRYDVKERNGYFVTDCKLNLKEK